MNKTIPFYQKITREQQICLLLALCGLLGFVLCECVSALGMDDTFHSRSDNIFYYLFTTYDRWHLLFFTATSLVFFLIFGGAPSEKAAPPKTLSPRLLWIWVAAVIVFCSLGTHFVFLNYPFAMDEFYSDFQAAIFAQGKVFATIPKELSPLAAAAAPLLVNYNPVAQTWTSNYLPVYALLRTPFWMLGCNWLLNPLLAGATLLATAGVIQRLWPEKPELRWVGVLLMATNVQFLITSMTAYAMSAHLLANLVWLWLYLDSSPKRQMLAPLLGVLAVGLHQPNVHLVFAFPFCIKLLLDKRWKMAAWYGLIYALGIRMWLLFIALKTPPVDASAGAHATSMGGFIINTFFSKLPNTTQLLDYAISWSKVTAWSPFALILLMVIALCQFKKLTAIHYCLLAGLILASLITLLFPLNQGHGWGNRYLFPYLGNMTLLAVVGFENLQKSISGRKVIIASSMISLLFALPARIWECHRVVRPFAIATSMIHSLPIQVAVIDTGTIWYGQDLVRNEPGLKNTPKLVFISRYSEGVDAYCRTHPASGRISFHHLGGLGIKPRHAAPPVKKPTN